MQGAAPGLSVRKTVRALLDPRRLLPILLVLIPLTLTERKSPEPLAIPLGLLMCLVSVFVAPISWRVLFPQDLEPLPLRHVLMRLSLYAAIGAGVLLSLGVVIPRLLHMGQTFLTTRGSLLVCGALFLVGGWGLGRDIGFEARLLWEKARGEALAREAERAQLLALRAHLDPHFLFNTLNAIAEWCREDGATAERAVLELSSLLRAVLAGVKRPTWPLRQELELVKTLFALHLLRDSTRFTLVLDLPKELPEVEVPPLLLLPLAENAVKHGPAAGHRGEIKLSLEPAEDRLLLVLENPGKYQGPRPGSDGLPTVEKRLSLAYAGQASLRIGGVAERTIVELTLPRAGPAGVVT